MSGSRFAPGDLVLIIGSTDPEDIGKSAEVVHVLVDDKPVIEFCGELFVGDCNGKWCAIIELNGDLACFEQTCLMPLKGDFQPEQVRELEVQQ